MNATEREQAIDRAARIDAMTTGHSVVEQLLAAGLLAEHKEVLAGREEIRRLGDAVRKLTARAIEAEQRHAADLAAARGVTTRLREALLSGATDAEQAGALIESMRMADGTWAFRLNDETRRLACAFLALHEEHKALRAELARLRERARVIGMGPAL